MEPRFFIIGERKCGTSSLYRYICDHPEVLPCKVKEPQFFSRSLLYRTFNFGRYKRLFPRANDTAPISLDWWILDEKDNLRLTTVQYSRGTRGKEITGEASANTFDTVPAILLKAYYEEASVILCMRNPTLRAFSHYRMFQRFAGEGRKLPFVLTNFTEDVRREIAAYQAGQRTYFVGQGVYVDKYESWKQIFREGMIEVIAEELNDPETSSEILAEITRRLGLDSHDFSDILKSQYNTAAPLAVPEEAKHLLDEFYRPSIDRLSNELKRDLPWK